MPIIIFIFGSIIGSFLNVIVLRWDLPRRGGASFAGRSACPCCGKILQWHELVPILSFLIQKGKCTSCKASISWQYPLVEALTGFVLLSLYLVFGLTAHFLLLALVFCLYIAILVYDIYHKIIPDELVYLAIFVSLLIPLFVVRYSLFDWLSGPIIFAFFGAIWLFSRGRAMGFGDAKLGLSVGLALGASQGLSAIIMAFWIGTVVSLFYIFLGKTGFLKDAKRLTMKSEVPFAPFIILGAWVSVVFGLNILYVAFS